MSELGEQKGFILPPDAKLSAQFDEKLDRLTLIFIPDVPWILDPVENQEHPESNTWWLVNAEDHSRKVGLMIEDLEKHFLRAHRQ